MEQTNLTWSMQWRCISFFLASTSLLALLLDFYHIISMRLGVFLFFLPSMVLLFGLVLMALYRSKVCLGMNLLVGMLSGLLATAAYDLFRVPFVFAHLLHLQDILPQMDLFEVFPQFGAMILGEPAGQGDGAWAAHLLGWVYHFSNGITLGVMYIALLGDARGRSWLWAVVFSVGLELGMLLTPYPKTFGIEVSPTFVVVTLLAHMVFGVALGVLVRFLGGYKWVVNEPV